MSLNHTCLSDRVPLETGGLPEFDDGLRFARFGKPAQGGVFDARRIRMIMRDVSRLRSPAAIPVIGGRSGVRGGVRVAENHGT